MVWQEANCIKEAFHFGKENRRSQSYYRIPLSCIGFTGAYIKRYAEERRENPFSYQGSAALKDLWQTSKSLDFLQQMLVRVLFLLLSEWIS